jgi:hypothetical protein
MVAQSLLCTVLLSTGKNPTEWKGTPSRVCTAKENLKRALLLYFSYHRMGIVAAARAVYRAGKAMAA